MKQMKVIITDDIERDSLIAEIWYDDKIIAEVNSEKEELEIEFYNISGLLINLNDLMDSIEIAKNKLKR